MRYIIETVKIKLRRLYIKSTSIFRKRTLLNRNFTIISNNCWGGFIYQSYHLPYLTPTIGLYFMSEDYIVFLENIEECLEAKLTFIEREESKYYSIIKNEKNIYPIGVINIENKNIEIHFLHYESKDEAREKWYERSKRVNMDNLLVKFCDQNMCTLDLLNRFEALPFKNKIFFGAKKYTHNTIFVTKDKNKDFVSGIHEPFGKSKYLNITRFLNNMK